MTARASLAIAAISVALAPGCFDSLISGACAPGFSLAEGACVSSDTAPDGGADAPIDAALDARLDGALDARLDGAPDALPDALTCAPPTVTCASTCTDLATDADNCGACGHVCASGLCDDGACVGELPGRIIAIGHDYAAWNGAMARALANAAALAPTADLAIGRWRGTSTSSVSANVTVALTTGLLGAGRAWHDVTWPAAQTADALAGIDVVLVEPQAGTGEASDAAGSAWGPALAAFIESGGVVVLLEGATTTTHRFAAGAGILTMAPPVPATGQRLVVTAPGDAIAAQVVSPYLAAATTVVFPDLAPAVVATESGGTVIFHTVRY